MEHPDILLVGSANAVFDAIRNHGKPFYEFFRLLILRGLGREDCLRILEALAEHEGRKEIPEILNRERGRLETVRRLTGGNPRLLVLACRMLIESPLGSAFEDLERLIDEQTPYFKARIEELPVQARKVFHCLAERWTPMLARELSVAAKLSSSHASAQLRQLVEKGYAKEVRIPREKRVRYEVGDRFYNIYYLLRFSRTGRDRLERLVAFLHDLFGSTGTRSMYPATLEALRARAISVGEISDLLAVLASHVAEDREFSGREDWRRQATLLAKDMIGIDAPVLGKIEQAFYLTDSVQLSFELIKAGRFADAETVCRKVIRDTPKNAAAWLILGSALFQQKRFEDALTAFQQVTESVNPDDSVGLRMVAVTGLACEVRAFVKLKELEAARATVERGSANIHVDDPQPLCELATTWPRLHGDDLARMNQKDKAPTDWRRVSEYVRPDDPQPLRRQVAIVFEAEGDALAELGRQEEALSAWERVTEHVRVEDPLDLRSVAVSALIARGDLLITLGRHEDVIVNSRWSSEYVCTDDPPNLRRVVAVMLGTGGVLLNAFGKYDESEPTCRMATDIEPTYGEAWRVLAAAILGQNDDMRLREAEDCARRAVELGPADADALQTLSDILANSGNWSEALELLERVVHTDDVRKNWGQPGLTASLIKLVAVGHGARVKRLVEDAGLVESMEPLWHATRADLGEELEPLPAEIMDTVTNIRQKFAKERQGNYIG